MTKAEILDLAARYTPGEYDDPGVGLFALLVDVADVYLQRLEEQMPTDTPESPFVGSAMPIEVCIWGLEENLEARQDTGERIK